MTNRYLFFFWFFFLILITIHVDTLMCGCTHIFPLSTCFCLLDLRIKPDHVSLMSTSTANVLKALFDDNIRQGMRLVH